MIGLLGLLLVPAVSRPRHSVFVVHADEVRVASSTVKAMFKGGFELFRPIESNITGSAAWPRSPEGFKCKFPKIFVQARGTIIDETNHGSVQTEE